MNYNPLDEMDRQVLVTEINRLRRWVKTAYFEGYAAGSKGSPNEVSEVSDAWANSATKLMVPESDDSDG